MLLVIGGSNLQSQEAIDSVKFRISYTLSYKTNPLQPNYSKTDLMYLDIGEKASKFYSRYEQIRDSIHREGFNNNLSINEINSLKSTYTRGTPRIYYHLLKDSKFTGTDRFVFLYALYEDKAKIPEWNIIDNEVKEIAGYACIKAIAKYLGREWHVYFTPQIPINMGPWKLWGLPGLIIEASDKDSFFKYELHGFEKIQNTPIIYAHKNYDNKEYTVVDKNTFRKMERLYNEDNSEFMKVFLGIKSISVTNPDGTVVEGKISIPYIPLEPW
jgi:GLPGLI family protein